jgi:hypothetical protein
VNHIGYSAFARSGIQTVTLPAALTRISNNTFYNCTSLTQVTFPEGLKYIGEFAFRGCSNTNFKTLTLPNGLEEIDNWAFYDCRSLTQVTLPATVEMLAEGNPFSNCVALTEFIVIGQGQYSTIDDGKGLVRENTLVQYPAANGAVDLKNKTTSSGKKVTAVGNAAFSAGREKATTRLTSVILPDELTAIPNNAFWSCTSLTSVTIPAGLKTIGIQAFLNCNALTTIDLPETVEFIDNQAFRDVGTITIICRAVTPPVLGGQYVFTPGTTPTIRVPSASVSAYRTAWNNNSIQAIP